MESKMKDSGIDFIGLIPNDWDVKRIKYETTFINGNAFDSNDLIVDGQYYVIRIGDIKDGCITLENALTINENTNLDNYKIQENDILLAMSGATVGKIGLVKNIEQEMYANQRVGIIRTNMNETYLSFLLRTKEFYDYIQLISLGSAQPNISTFSFGNYRIPLPPVEEQTLIAQYLDKKVPKIEKVIDTIKKEIRLLEQTKKSIITECVTKGLNKDVELKDSGVEHIGNINSEYKVKKIKYIATLSRGASPRPIENYLSENENDVNWIKIGDTIKNYKYIDYTKQKITQDGATQSKCVDIGDLILTNSMSCGEPYILNIDGCIHDGWIVFSNIKEFNKEFLYYSLISNICYSQFKTLANGAVVNNLNIEKVANTKVVIPTIKEQQEIVNYLDKKCDAIDRIIDTKNEQISKLETHKQSLIYDYVTGKKRVKGVE